MFFFGPFGRLQQFDHPLTLCDGFFQMGSPCWVPYSACELLAEEDSELWKWSASQCRLSFQAVTASAVYPSMYLGECVNYDILRTSNNFWIRSGKSIWAGFYYQTTYLLGKCHVTSLEFTKMYAIYVLFPIGLLDSKLWKASNFANLEGNSTVITCDFLMDRYYKTSVKTGGSQLLTW